MTDKVNILVVDDLPEKILVVETILGDLGENIVCAHSGEEALRLVLQQEFAVILLDVNMPGMDGLETAAFIRRRKKCAHTPIIFITAYADEMHTAQGYSLGAVDYILAPVVPDVLRTKVKVFVDLFRMTQQARKHGEQQAALARAEAERQAAEAATSRSNFLVEASTALSSSLEFERSLHRLAELVVPFLADLSGVTRIDEHGRLGSTTLVWNTTETGLRQHHATQPTSLPPPLVKLLEHALASGRKQTTGDGDAWLLPVPEEPSNRNGASWHLDFEVSGAVVLPLQARGRTLGMLTVARGPSGRRFESADVALAEDLAARAAVALDNAHLYENIQEGDRRKNEFLAMLAHELRNPLAPICNAVELLQIIGSTDAEAIKLRGIIERQVNHMTRLVDDLLDMSRLSRGKILLRKDSVNLTELVGVVVEDHRPMLEAAELRLHVELPDVPVWTHGDKTRLGQVVGNLLHNARKFTDSAGEVFVTLSAEPDGAFARLSVRDTGIGMDANMLGRLFEMFSQADGSLDRSRGGLGLGLALVKGLVELHNGQVSATSEGHGKGAELTIRLPLEKRAFAPKRHLSGPVLAATRRKVLVIEDNKDTAESMRLLLSVAGHDVRVALTGKTGIETAREFLPEVIVCDIGLPGTLNGYEVARTLRTEPSLETTLLIAATGYGRPEDQERARQAGFDTHLIKPVDLTELRRLLTTRSPRPEPV